MLPRRVAYFIWCMSLPGNVILSSVPEPLSLKVFVCSNIFSNVCSEPESSFRTAISFNLYQRKSTDEQWRWRSITWVFIWRGSGELARSKKKGKRSREEGTLWCYIRLFVFVICALQHFLGAQWQMACGVLSFHFSLCQTHTHTLANAQAHMHIMCTHAKCTLIPHWRLICSGYCLGTELVLKVLQQLCCLLSAYQLTEETAQQKTITHTDR